MRKTTLALMIGAALTGSAQAQAADLWDIYQLAVQNDPTFLQAEANYQAQTENKAIARAGYLPNISLNGSRQVQHSSGQIPLTYDPTTNSYIEASASFRTYNTQYSAQLTQPIFNWAAWQAIDQADAQVAQAEAQFTAAQEDLIQRTATAYFNVLNARDTLAADHAAKEALSKQLEQAKEKYEVGMSAITDVENAQAAYDQSVANEITAQQQVTTTEEQLRAITGQQAGELMEPSVDMPLRSPEPSTAQQWVDQAMKQNPNLLAAQSAADAASANVGIKRAGHLPTLGLTLSHTKNTNEQVTALAGTEVGSLQDISGNTAMLQLSIPLFEGGGTQAQVSQAERQYDAAMDDVKLVSRHTEQQARTAFLGVLTGISQVQALKQSVKSNQTSMDATETGMEVGTRTIVDVLTARQNLLTAQTGFSNARYTYLESLLQLKQAAGILTENDIKQINTLMQVKVPNLPMDTGGLDMGTPAAGTMAAPAAASTSAPAGTTAAPAVTAPAAGTTAPTTTAPAAGTSTLPAETPPPK
ncbi:MAG TPA: TolC family outer membrane protein [Gammaproteobacteria bacterium]|nr:TolC family outer membrane protein [Gammaproteobacteria bacterium]